MTGYYITNKNKGIKVIRLLTLKEGAWRTLENEINDFTAATRKMRLILQRIRIAIPIDGSVAPL